MIRNGFKTFAGNFMVVWKHALYLFIVFGVIASLFVWASIPIVEKLIESGWVEELRMFFEQIFTAPIDIAENFNELVGHFMTSLYNHSNEIWANYALSLFLILFVPCFLYYVGEYVVGVLLGESMTSLVHTSYTHKLISTLGRSSLYALMKFLISIPFVMIAVSLCYAYTLIAEAIAFAWMLVPVFIAVIVLVFACKYVFCMGFLSESVMKSYRVTKCFAKGITQYGQGFFKKVLLVWGLLVLEAGAIILITVFTLGAGLIIAIPSITVLNVAVMHANYFQTRKENFYTSENSIIKTNI